MTETRRSLVGYIRISTDRQARNGWSFEAQRDAIENYCRVTGHRLVSMFVETESGKRSDRPMLDKTIQKARGIHGVVAVAVLDLLCRNSLVIHKLLETGIDFVDCQRPNDTPFIARIKATVVQEEREKISRRTIDGLAAAKREGVLLGSARPGAWDGMIHCPECRGSGAKDEGACPACQGTKKGTITRVEARRRGALVASRIGVAKLRRQAREYHAALVPLMRQLRAEGLSLAKIADRLNQEGHVTQRGLPWHKVGIKAVLDRHNQGVRA